MAARQNQLIGDHGRAGSSTITQNRVPMGRPLKEVAHLDQPIAGGGEKPKKTAKPHIVKSISDERSGRHWQAPVSKGDDKKADHFIAEYEMADFNRRLQMYLQMPQLRSKFDSIHQDMQNTDLSSEFKLRGRSFATQMGMALGSAMACRGL